MMVAWPRVVAAIRCWVLFETRTLALADGLERERERGCLLGFWSEQQEGESWQPGVGKPEQGEGLGCWEEQELEHRNIKV